MVLKNEFLDSKNPRNHILHCSFSQTIEKLFFKMADGGHFGFLPTATYAHTFESDTPPVLFIDRQRRQKH